MIWKMRTFQGRRKRYRGGEASNNVGSPSHLEREREREGEGGGEGEGERFSNNNVPVHSRPCSTSALLGLFILLRQTEESFEM